MYYGLILTMGILMGIFATELAINNKCSGIGVYDSWFFFDTRCAPIQKVETLEEAKAIIKQHQERVK